MERKDKAATSPIQTLSPHEWDFSQCPDEQKRLCCYYEHLRSLEAVRSFYQRYDKKDLERLNTDSTFVFDTLDALVTLPDEERWVGLSEQKEPFQPLLATIIRIPEFPDEPWQKIAGRRWPEVQAELKSMVRVYPDASVEHLQELAESRQSHSDSWPEIVTYLRIPLGKTMDEILDAFRDEMAIFASEYPQYFRPQTGGRGRYSHKDRLKQLGAWRLLKIMPNKVAREYTVEMLNDEAGLYSSGDEMRKAAKKAQAFLDALVAGR